MPSSIGRRIPDIPRRSRPEIARPPNGYTTRWIGRASWDVVDARGACGIISTKSIVFLESGPQPMARTPESSSVLLLERPGADAALRLDIVDPVGEIPALGPDFRSPALGLLAALSILEGYRWLGIIPAGDARISSFVFGRIGALAFAPLALVMASAIARPGAQGHRALTHRMVVLAAVAVVAASASARTGAPRCRPLMDT